MIALKQSGDYKNLFRELGVQVTESSVAFMESKSKLVHIVAMIAKFWSQQQLFEKYISGRSTIIELLAVKAALDEENNDTNPFAPNAFYRFLEKVHNIDKTNIIFTDYYNEAEIPTEILGQTPLLMDPVNPYNNLLGGECGYGYGKIQSTSKDLKEFMSFMSKAAGICLLLIAAGCTDLNTIFCPHPLLIERAKKEKWLIPKNGSYLVSICSNNDPEIGN